MTTINYINIIQNIQFIEDILNKLIKIMCNNNKPNLNINLIKDKLMTKVDKTKININLIDNIVEQMINEYIKSGLINKACLYKNLLENKSLNNENSYVNLRDLLISDTPSKQNTNDDFFVCSFNNNKLICSHIKQDTHCLNCNKHCLNCKKQCLNCNKQCLNCNKWENSRSQFKYQIMEIINEEQIVNVIKLLPKTINLLPTIILDKDSYDNFIKALDAYIKSKRYN
jgi:hypothetical protein